MAHDDLDLIMAVMSSAFAPEYGEAWNRRQVEDALVMGHCHYALIGADGADASGESSAAGFFLSRLGFEEEELLLLAVAPEHRRIGLASTLLRRLISESHARGAKRLLLEMRRGNPAEKLYAALGFVPIGERLNYYRSTTGDRLDAITFARPLP